MGQYISACQRRVKQSREISFGFRYTSSTGDDVQVATPVLPPVPVEGLITQFPTQELPDGDAVVNPAEEYESLSEESKQTEPEEPEVEEEILVERHWPAPFRLVYSPTPTAPPREVVEVATSPISESIVELKDIGVNTVEIGGIGVGTSTETNTETVVCTDAGANTENLEQVSVETNTVSNILVTSGTNTDPRDWLGDYEPSNWEILAWRVNRLRFLRRLSAQLSHHLRTYSNVTPNYITDQ
jgi:hypothetical protein